MGEGEPLEFQLDPKIELTFRRNHRQRQRQNHANMDNQNNNNHDNQNVPGLSEDTQQSADVVFTGGMLISSYNQIKNTLDVMASNSQEWRDVNASLLKFLKDILANKRRITDFETVALTQTTKEIFKNRVPEKMTDLGSFMVSCSIGRMYLGRSLCDLGASINLMPLSIFKKSKIGEVQPTHMRLQFADRSIAKLKDKIKDILV
ncbi:uncharacterized protein E6C27_scaffold316G001640 [Cucumis melo var. makuwa]|uniref:Uncharacterized protein n=1 Tax=Cucumis melo var. makuwa TaxID=1194695 RepID=A0A5A7TU65_CUCMM|nr:uncharacterized protein E6C27_scaffold316G001640 [Cucumis melo var. makuwa]